MIDGEKLSTQPETIDILPADYTDSQLSGGGRVIVESLAGVTINANYDNENLQGLLAEIQRKRFNVGPHMLTVEDTLCDATVSLWAYMAKIPQNALGYASGGPIAYSGVTIAFVQITPVVGILPFEFSIRNVITVGDDKWKVMALAAGEFTDVDGFIKTLGTGAGGTKIQLRNETQGRDYLGPRGDFVVAGGNHVLQNQTLVDDASFLGGDIIALDVDAIPANSDSADFVVTAHADAFRT